MQRSNGAAAGVRVESRRWRRPGARAAAADRVMNAAGARIGPTDVPPRSLLLADDDTVFRDVLAKALRRRGYRVETAGDVSSALQRIAETPPTSRSSTSKCRAHRV